MNGKKTYIAGIALILTGVAGFVLGFAQPESVHAIGFDQALTLVLNGLGAIGLRHAIEKK